MMFLHCILNALAVLYVVIHNNTTANTYFNNKYNSRHDGSNKQNSYIMQIGTDYINATHATNKHQIDQYVKRVLLQLLHQMCVQSISS